MGMEINRFEVFLVNLDPTIGHEIKKTRPCLVISPNEMNHYISTVIVAPMTTKGRKYPTRISCTFKGKKGQIVLDQIRTVDKKRLVKKLGPISKSSQEKTLTVLQELFAE
jgi:mRNA interferase MazF